MEDDLAVQTPAAGALEVLAGWPSVAVAKERLQFALESSGAPSWRVSEHGVGG
jgi:hypothetical protein